MCCGGAHVGTMATARAQAVGATISRRRLPLWRRLADRLDAWADAVNGVTVQPARPIVAHWPDDIKVVQLDDGPLAIGAAPLAITAEVEPDMLAHHLERRTVA